MSKLRRSRGHYLRFRPMAKKSVGVPRLFWPFGLRNVTWPRVVK
jgi:hypothetical protein